VGEQGAGIGGNGPPAWLKVNIAESCLATSVGESSVVKSKLYVWCATHLTVTDSDGAFSTCGPGPGELTRMTSLAPFRRR
jgi:hypothetical protein